MGNNIDLSLGVETRTMTERAIFDVDDAFKRIRSILRKLVTGILAFRLIGTSESAHPLLIPNQCFWRREVDDKSPSASSDHESEFSGVAPAATACKGSCIDSVRYLLGLEPASSWLESAAEGPEKSK
jgi:hypothetical protein